MARGATSMAPRQLFGGAITMDLPVLYGDASDLRQIPDNQEVFLSPNSDTSLVIEVLALVEEGLAASDLWEAAKFHFDSIAHDNASISTQILTPAPTTPLPSRPYPYPTPSPAGPASTSTPTPQPTILTGSQRIHKFSHDPSGAPRPGHEADEADEVVISLALWRVWLEGGEEDAAGSAAGGAAGSATRKKKKADVVCSVNVNLTSTDGQGEEEMRRVEGWWRAAVDSLKIVDYGLFGDTE